VEMKRIICVLIGDGGGLDNEKKRSNMASCSPIGTSVLVRIWPHRLLAA